jgi:hypothetical protein
MDGVKKMMMNGNFLFVALAGINAPLTCVIVVN